MGFSTTVNLLTLDVDLLLAWHPLFLCLLLHYPTRYTLIWLVFLLLWCNSARDTFICLPLALTSDWSVMMLVGSRVTLGTSFRGWKILQHLTSIPCAVELRKLM